MRIGLDARTMTQPRPRGTGRNLLDAYHVLPHLRPQWSFTLYHQHPRPDHQHPHANGAADFSGHSAPAFGRNVRWRQIDLPGDRLDLWLHLRLPSAAWLDGIDLLHLPANAAPLLCPVPYVVTVHDLIPLRLPDAASPSAVSWFRRRVGRAVRGAMHIITPSAATGRDVQECFGVAPERISVIPWAPDALISAERTAEQWHDEIERLSFAHDLKPPWLVTFSGSSPRKNARRLLEGFGRMSPANRGRTTLVMVGCEPQRRREELAREAARHGIAKRCRILGFLPHEDLPGLLRGSRGLLIPSRYEGFGLPILDAFACEVPVLAARASSLPEVAGGAALYCNPDDADSIARGIERLLDPTTAAGLVERGRQRVQEFTWRRTAEAMCGVYERAVARANLRVVRQAITAPAGGSP